MDFVVRAHSAPTDAARFLDEVGTGAHVEYLAQIVIASLFVSRGHRADVSLTLVLEHSRDFSRAITLSGASLGSLHGLTEAAILETLAAGLNAARDLGKEQSISLDNGIRVASISFERLAKRYLAAGSAFLLDKKGSDLREQPIPDDAVFFLTDHVPMPRNLHKSLVRQGAAPVSVGPVMLQAAQCIVVVQNEIDRRV
jgi:tRNA (pseudouridine54-N1)-methyltransferase